MDPLILARIQFAANITFHILFPVITIALAWVLLFFKIRYSVTGDSSWRQAYVFWTKVFALCFALGVVSGITMSFQFGTNWPGFMLAVGNIAGPLLGYEVLTAFFLEATFLGIMLFGWDKVSSKVHTLATFLVAFGTTLSAYWILALNSWMQTPVGFEMIDGKAYATDWFAILMAPSMPYRFTHMVLASGLTAVFLIAGLSAWRWLRGDRGADVKHALRTALVVAAVVAPLQVFVGDLHGLNTLAHQPAKVAAMEGLWQTRAQAPLVLFGIPDANAKTNHAALEVPGLTSLILRHDVNGVVQGLDAFEGNHPPVAPVFFAFRIMVGIGVLMILAAWWGVWRLFRAGDLSPMLARFLVLMTFSGWIATIAGWYVTEIGRQPWLVQGVLTTAQAASAVPPAKIGLTLTLYLVVYGVLLLAFIRTLFFMAGRAGQTFVPSEQGSLHHALEGERRSLLVGASEQ